MNRVLLKTDKPITQQAVREMRHLLEQVTQTTIPQLALQRAILLCFSEAATNLVQHAASEATQMSIQFGRDNTFWWLEIYDNNAPWNPAQYKKINDLSDFHETESGRGISLLHKLSEQLQYNSSSDSKLNQLRLSWKIPEQSRQPKILIVEDDEPLRRLYQLYLSGAFEVSAVGTGEQALQVLKAQQIDLLLSDICMPQMDGIALREQIIQDSHCRLMPFVFLTAMKDTGHIDQASNLGIDDYLLKPVSKAQLISTIERVLKRTQQIHQQLTQRIDKSISASLVPQLPEQTHGWHMSLASRHTGSGGGDILLHQSCNKQLQLIVVDIMGHDDSAKFFAHACAGYIRGVMTAMGADNDPAQLLAQLSDYALQDKLMSQVTLTCLAATLSSGGKINLSCAGHPPPLLISKTSAHPISIGGILPGLLPTTDYQTLSLQLNHGERIALYTDGLFESAADNHGRVALEKKMMEILTDTHELPLSESLAQAMCVFDELAGSPPPDDALLLLMEPHE